MQDQHDEVQGDVATETPTPRRIVRDLSALDIQAPAERGIELHLESPIDGEPLFDEEEQPVFVGILGEDSPKVKKHDKAVADRKFARLNRNKNVDVDTDSLESEQIQRAIVATTRWNLPPIDGQKLECNEKNMRRVYFDPRFRWIPEQIIRAMKERKRFFESASTT